MSLELGYYVFLGVLGVAAIGGSIASVVFSRDNRLKRRIRKAAPTTIGSAELGTVVRLSGTIEPLERRLQAPMTGRECVYFLAVVEVYRSSGRSGSWVEVAREEEGEDFLLRDRSGVLRVHMRAAQVAVVRDHHTKSGTFDDATASESGFLQRHNLEATTSFGFNQSYRYTEGALEPGEQVGVLGTVAEVDGQRVLRPGAEPDILVSDDPSTLAPRG